ncbi:MAG: thioesterase family protein [Pseudomonadota bacterium]
MSDSFIDLLKVVDHSGTAKIHLSDAWTQGRAMFGGVVAALAIRVANMHHLKIIKNQIQNIADAKALLRSAQILFLAPIESGDVVFTAKLLRQGRSVTHYRVEGVQDDAIKIEVLCTIASPRDTSIADHNWITTPNLSLPDSVKDLPFVPNIMPNFSQRFQYRWLTGGALMSGSQDNKIGGWCRAHDVVAQTESVKPYWQELLVCLADAWPPAVLSRATKIAPASSMSWMLEWVQPITSYAPDQWFGFTETIDSLHKGYAATHHILWAAQQQPLIIGRQTIAYF